jgi:hypothetical protein
MNGPATTAVRRLLLVLAPVVALLAIMLPANAEITGGDGGGGDQTLENGQTVGIRYGCRVSAGPSYLGLSCPGIRNRLSIRELLCPAAVAAGAPTDGKPRDDESDDKPGNPNDKPGDKPKPKKKDWVEECPVLKECWEIRRVSKQELEAANLEQEEGSTWYWTYCIDGVQLEWPYRVEGDIEVEASLTQVPDGEKPRRITQLQQQLVDRHDGGSSVPRPFAMAGPNPTVLVNRPTAFYEWNTWQFDDHRSMSVPAGDVYIKAVVRETKVEPFGVGKQVQKTCPGAGRKVGFDDTPQTAPDACWVTYDQSSAFARDNVYHVRMTTSWDVYVFGGGEAETLDAEHHFTSFEKAAITRVPVREVQAIVVR